MSSVPLLEGAQETLAAGVTSSLHVHNAHAMANVQDVDHVSAGHCHCALRVRKGLPPIMQDQVYAGCLHDDPDSLWTRLQRKSNHYHCACVTKMKAHRVKGYYNYLELARTTYMRLIHSNFGRVITQ
jgi:hypothetical protein